MNKRLLFFAAIVSCCSFMSSAVLPAAELDNPGLGSRLPAGQASIELRWLAAEGASAYQVYFGADFLDVDGADTDSEAYRGQTEQTSLLVENLDYDRHYYWRVDAVHPTGTSKGQTWDFWSPYELLCGMEGQIYKIGDLNKDCYVNIADVELIARQWLSCTDPANPGCDLWNGSLAQTLLQTGLVYVDAEHGVGGNTVDAATGDPSSWQSTANDSYDTIWRTRSGNGATAEDDVYEASGKEDAVLLKTTVTGLTAGAYDVYVYFGTNTLDPTYSWDIQAGLDPNLLASYTPQDDGELIADTSDVDMYRAFVGVATVDASGELAVYIDNVENGNKRTWYDGIAYEPNVPDTAPESDYVDAEHGESGNTVDAVTEDPSSWQDPVYTADPDTLWRTREGRSEPAEGTVYEASGHEDAVMLKTTVTGLAAGWYNVYVYFGTNTLDPTYSWDIQAGLDPNQLTTYTPQDDGELIADTSDVDMYRALVGVASVDASGELVVYVDNVINGNKRTWYDGIGYEPGVPYCGLNGQLYKEGDINRDCYVNIEDLAELASEWLQCTDPNNWLNCSWSGSTDVFVDFGQTENTEVPGLEGNPPPELPQIDLPWQGTDVLFSPQDKMDTQQEFDAALEQMRIQYAPFMADLAPELPQTRSDLSLTTFQWRLATDADKVDIQYPLSGAGTWEQVDIPHYGGPVNQAMSFYRTEFQLTEEQLQNDRLVLHFNGADYIADVYLNDTHLGSHEGLFDPFEFDIKAHATVGTNTLLVQMQNDAIMMGDNFVENWVPDGRQYGKKFAACGGPGWDNPVMGWVMCPPGFGIWQKVYLEFRPAVSISDIFVQPRPQDAEAEVWVEMEGQIDDGIELRYSLYGQNFTATISEDTAAVAEVVEMGDGKTSHRFTIPLPRTTLRWWSHNTPWLYQLQVFAYRDGVLMDVGKRQIGMRTFVQSTTSEPMGRFYLNGKEIKLRGANMMGNLMQDVMRDDYDQLRDDILIAKLANMTFWRMTQQPCQEEVYDYFDKLGMLAQTDFPAFVGIWSSQHDEAVRELEAMVRLVRSHPCNAFISYLNEPSFDNTGGRAPMMSRTEIEDLFHEFDQQMRILNPLQVRKWVDGDYANLSQGYSDHHNYSGWYGSRGGAILSLHNGYWCSTRAGWMHGCGEYGAEGLDSVATMMNLYPGAWIQEGPGGTWSPSQIYRCQTGTSTGQAWLKTYSTMPEWVQASQDHQKWVARIQTEAFRRDAKMNSTAIHLLIDAWPAGWLKSIVSNDRTAKPAYFAFRDALTPLLANLRTTRYYIYPGETLPVEAWICNDLPTVPEEAKLAYQLELGGEVIQCGICDAAIVASEPTFNGFINVTAPEVTVRQPLTLRCALLDRQGEVLHDTSVVLDLIPTSEIGTATDKGGRPQRILSSSN